MWYVGSMWDIWSVWGYRVSVVCRVNVGYMVSVGIQGQCRDIKSVW